MAATAVRLDKLTVNPDGSVRAQFGKIGLDWSSVAAMREQVRANLTRDDLIALALALVLTRQPNLTNPAAFEGHSVSVDFTLANWGTLI